MTSLDCPNCGTEGAANWSNMDLDYDEWDCQNGNCRVSVYKVPKELTEQ